MAYAIGTLSGIPPALRAALARAAIADTDALLTAARFPSSRDALATELEVDASELDTWASVADLLRVTVFSPPVAELVVRSGVARNVQELARALGSSAEEERADPGITPAATPAVLRREARAGLESFARERGWQARVPPDVDLDMAAEEAANLTPRLVLRERALLDDERSRLRALERTAAQFSLGTLIGSVGLVTLLVAILGLALRWMFTGSVTRAREALQHEFPTGETAGLLDALQDWALAVVDANLWGLAVVAALLIGFMAIAFVATDLSDRLWTRFGLRFVLRTMDARREYLRILEDETRGTRHFARTYYGAVAIAMLASGAVLLATDLGTRGDRPLGEALVAIGALILPPFVVVVFWPSIGRLVRRYRHADPARASVIRGIVVYRIGDLVRAIAVIVFFIASLGPVLNAASSLGEGVARARVATSAAVWERDLDALGAAGHLEATQRQGLSEYAAEFGLRFGSITAGMSDIIEGITRDVLPRFVRALAPSLLLVILLFIVVPFLVLGGWLRGAFFLVLLLAITVTETNAQHLATAFFTQVFALPGDSLPAMLLVGFAVFGNAILFEWIFEFTVERKPPCAGCRAPVDRGARYCSHCGLAQR